MDAMGIWSTSWAPGVFNEAMKFWFYSISCSIALGVVQLVHHLSPVESEEEEGGKKKEGKGDDMAESKRKKDKHGGIMVILKKLVIDGCDLFIPGSVTGWLALSSANVGMLSVVSSILAGTDIWVRVQNFR